MANLRLALVTPRFWPLVGDRPTHFLRLAESLAALGHSPVIVTPQWNRGWPPQMTIGRVPLVRLRGSGRGGWNTLRWMYALASWLGEQRIDGVVVDGLRHEAYVALGAARRKPLPVALIAGDDDLAWQATATLGSRIAARCREGPMTIAACEHLAEALTAAGYAAHRLKVIPRAGVESPPRTPAARDAARAAVAAVNADLVVTANATVALAVGRLDATHRFGDLIRAWRIVTAHKPEARLWIVGDGPERETLYQQVGDLDQRFRVLLPGSFDCLDELLQASDMLLVPGAHAVTPLALLDAQAAGLPVIAANSLATQSFVRTHETGILFPAGDAKAIAASVLKWIEEPALRIQCGSAGRVVSQSRLTIADEARTFVDLLQSS
jgi:glycosyltransferase involved in cell wall biosynthesis